MGLSLIEIVKELRKNYEFLGMDTNLFSDIVEKELIRTQRICKKDKDKCFSSVFEERVVSVLDEYVTLGLKGEDSLGIINNFLNNNLRLNEEVRENIKELRKLRDFFGIYNYYPDEEVYASVIETNGSFNAILKSVLDSSYCSYDPFVKKLINIYNGKKEEGKVGCFYADDSFLLEEGKMEDSYMDGSLNEYLCEISKIPALSDEEEIILSRKAVLGERVAKEELIKGNLGLVVNIARTFVGRGISFLDLIQEGNLSLVRAVNEFDYNIDGNFSTYATSLINDAITKALDKQKVSNSQFLSLQQITDVVSFEMDEEDTQVRMETDIRNLLNDCKFSQLEMEVLKNEFGFLGEDPKGLEEIALTLGIKEKHVRQIEEQILNKMKKSSRIKTLATYLFPSWEENSKVGRGEVKQLQGSWQ